MRTVSIGVGRALGARGAIGVSRTASPAAIASTATASTTSARSGVAKPKRARCAAVKSATTLRVVAQCNDQRRLGAGIAQVQRRATW